MARLGTTVVLFAISLLSGCLYTDQAAPVDSRHAPLDRASVNPGALAPIQIVRPGDTLYSIAWQARRDFRDVARWNDIPPPYRISPGQRVRLSADGSKKKPQPVPEIDNDSGTEVIPLERPGASSHVDETSSRTSVSSPPARTATRQHVQINQPVKSWLWPASGKHRRQSGGIEISGSRGQPVRATAAGNVVYKGSGILGLGRLVIIKHNDTYLSAYAHNSEILVKEGQTVRQGETIARMGDTDAKKVALYFEIRKNGQPVNPLKYLARR